MPPAADWRAQQRLLDRFRQEYNEVRPHEALNMQTPASVYQPSPRAYPTRVPQPEYPDTMQVRSVQAHGHFRWKKHDVFLSDVLWGESIGLLPVDEDWFTVYFAQVPIARFNSRHLRVLPLLRTKPNPGRASDPAARAGAGEASPAPAPNPSLEEKLSGMCPV